MRSFIRLLLASLFLAALAGGVAGQSLQTTDETPAAAAATSGCSVLAEVTDDRPFVKNGDKPPYYLGTYRAGFANPWDVKTENEEPLASVVARDLATDLAALGHSVTTRLPADRRVAVSIKNWKFDGYQNGRLWYNLQVTVSDSSGKNLVTSAVKDTIHIKDSFWMGARGSFERDMPPLYARIIRRIARDNAAVSNALQKDSGC